MSTLRIIIGILFILVILTALGCSNSRYSQAPATPTLVFNYGDIVVDVANCTGVILGYSEEKSKCYPQPAYIVQFGERSSAKISYRCADELLLRKKGGNRE